MKGFFALAVILLFTINSQAQNGKYWIELSDKNCDNLTESIYVEAGARADFYDAPICNKYLNILQEKLEIKPIIKSRWLNAISCALNSDQLFALKSLSFVSDVTPISLELIAASVTEEDHDYSMSYLNAQAMIDAGLDGTGVKIGVIDCGFKGATNNPYTKEILESDRFIAQKDFVNPDNDDLTNLNETNLDFHGTRVLQGIGGLSEEGKRYGLANNAMYYLARTDHGDDEFRGEEDYWVAALEWLHSNGVRLVNSSLGYADKHDDKGEDYTPSQMDGKTTLITKAAGIAAREKGMIIITSAGNEGNRSWKVLSAPADSKDVLSIGAVDLNLIKAGYSSIGPDFLSYVKPDVVAYSTGGTSFSAPVITGLAACILQKKNSLSYNEVFDILRKSSHIYPFPNNLIGNGMPRCERVLELMENGSTTEVTELQSRSHKKIKITFSSKIPRGQAIIAYHKGENFVVKKQTKLFGTERKSVKIRRVGKAVRTTVSTGFEAQEIVWKDKR